MEGADGVLSMTGGRLVRARTAPPAAVDALRRLAGLAVPTIVEAREDRDEVALTTTYLPPIPAPSVSQLGEAAATVAAAHDRGVVHGALAPWCVGLDRELVVVDGWTGAGSSADDVAAFGLLLDSADPATASLARRCTSDDPAARPTMHAVADALHTLAAPAPHPRARSVSSAGHTGARGRHRTTKTAAIALLGLAAALITAVLQSAGATTVRPLVHGRGPMAGNVVTHDGVAVQVGRPGDVVAVGDWDCDGTTTPALLRADHTLWVWQSWQRPPHQRAVAPAAASLRVVAVRRGCDVVVPVDDDGRAVD